MKIYLTSEHRDSLASELSTITTELDKLAPVLKNWSAKQKERAKLVAEIEKLEASDDLTVEETAALSAKRDYVENLDRHIPRLEADLKPKSENLRQILQNGGLTIQAAFRPTMAALEKEITAEILPALDPYFFRYEEKASLIARSSDALIQFSCLCNRRLGMKEDIFSEAHEVVKLIGSMLNGKIDWEFKKS